MMMKRKSKLKGFTLLEVLIVLVVISILLLVGLPSLTKFSNSAKRRADDLNMAAIKEATMLYLTENQVDDTTKVDVKTLLDGGYLDSRNLSDDKQSKKLISPISNKDYLIKIENANTDQMMITVSNQETETKKTEAGK